MLALVLGLVYQSRHDCLWHHIIDCFPDDIEVGFNQLFYNVDFPISSWLTLSWIIKISPLEILHPIHMDWFYILLHVLVNFVWPFRILVSLNALMVILLLLTLFRIWKFRMLLHLFKTFLLTLINWFHLHSFFLLLFVFSLLKFPLIKESHNWVGSTHEIRVITINIRLLNCNQILDHLVCRKQALNKKVFHFFVQSFSKVWESIGFWKINLIYYLPELLIDKLNTLHTRRLKPVYLLFGKTLKCLLWNE